MPASRKTNPAQPHVTSGSVLDDLKFGPNQALKIKVKAEIYRDLLKYIHTRSFTPQQLTSLLHLHQPDVSNLLNGRVSKFSVGKLIEFAGRLDLGAQVKLIPLPAGTSKNARSKAPGPRKKATVAYAHPIPTP